MECTDHDSSFSEQRQGSAGGYGAYGLAKITSTHFFCHLAPLEVSFIRFQIAASPLREGSTEPCGKRPMLSSVPLHRQDR
jgi:hypothetical protein